MAIQPYVPLADFVAAQTWKQHSSQIADPDPLGTELKGLPSLSEVTAPSKMVGIKAGAAGLFSIDDLKAYLATQIQTSLQGYVDGALEEALADVSNLPVTATLGDTPRTLRQHAEDECNIKNYGGVGNGTTSDQAAMEAAITDAIAKDKILRLPSGIYRLTNAISKGGLRGIKGAGKGLTKVIWDEGAAGGLTFTFPAQWNRPIHIEGVSFLRNGRGGSALTLDFTALAGLNYAWPGIWPRFQVLNCEIGGNDEPHQATGWSSGIIAVAGAYGQVVGCDINGWHTIDGLTRDASPGCAIQFRGTVDNQYHNGHPVVCLAHRNNIQHFACGIQFNGCEGAIARDNSIVSCDVGIGFYGSTNTSGATNTARPYCVISGNHCNSHSRCAEVVDCVDFTVTDNCFYRILGAVDTTYGILVDQTSGSTGTGYGLICDNMLCNTDTVNDFQAVVIPTGLNILIDRNVFRIVDKAVWLGDGSNACRVGAANLYGAVNTTVLDTGTGNIIAVARVGAPGTQGWERSSSSVEHKWGNSVVTLDASGNGSLAYDQPFKTNIMSVVVCSGDPNNLAGMPVLDTTNSNISTLAISVRPNPGAGSYRIAWQAIGY